MLKFGIRRSTRLVGHRGQEAFEDLADELEQVELGLDVLAQEKVLAHVREEGLLDALGRHEELGVSSTTGTFVRNSWIANPTMASIAVRPCVSSCSSMRFRRSGASLSGNNPSGSKPRSPGARFCPSQARPFNRLTPIPSQYAPRNKATPQ